MKDFATFALARITEDEAQARSLSCDQVHPQMDVYCSEPHEDKRALAECKVKRNIVQRYLRVAKANNGTDLANGMLMAHEADVRDLVAVWEDHPDYDDDWEL